MAMMAAALGSLLAAMTHQAAKALIDQRVTMLINREANFFLAVPYPDLDSNKLENIDANAQNLMNWQPYTPADRQATSAYRSSEGEDGNAYLLTVQTSNGSPDPQAGRYHYLITRELTIYPDHKTVDISIQWQGAASFHAFTHESSNPAADWPPDPADPSTDRRQIRLTTIYRYP